MVAAAYGPLSPPRGAERMKALLVAALVLATLLAVVPSGEAKPIPGPDCMPVYSRTDVGNLAIVRPNSCTVRVYWCPSEGAPISECDPLVG